MNCRLGGFGTYMKNDELVEPDYLHFSPLLVPFCQLFCIFCHESLKDSCKVQNIKKRYLKNIVLSWNWNWVPRWWRKVRLVQSCIFIPRSAVQDFLGLSSKSKISYHPEIEIESREGWGWANLALQIARRRRHAQLGQLAEKPHNCIYTGRYMIYVSYTCIYILISIYFSNFPSISVPKRKPPWSQSRLLFQ